MSFKNLDFVNAQKNASVEVPEKLAFLNCETPEFHIYEGRIKTLQEKLAKEEELLKKSSGIFSKFRIWNHIRETKYELEKQLRR